MALCPGLPRWASTRKVKPIWISLQQETGSGSGITWAICKSAPRSTPAPHHSVLQAGFPSCYPTNSIKALKAKRSDVYFHRYAGRQTDKLITMPTTGRVINNMLQYMTSKAQALPCPHVTDLQKNHIKLYNSWILTMQTLFTGLCRNGPGLRHF